MTEKPFVHKKAFSNLKSNFMFHEDLTEILPKILNKKGAFAPFLLLGKKY